MSDQAEVKLEMCVRELISKAKELIEGFMEINYPRREHEFDNVHLSIARSDTDPLIQICGSVYSPYEEVALYFDLEAFSETGGDLNSYFLDQVKKRDDGVRNAQSIKEKEEQKLAAEETARELALYKSLEVKYGNQ